MTPKALLRLASAIALMHGPALAAPPMEGESPASISRITGLQMYKQPSSAMTPTISAGAYVMGDTSSYATNDPNVGDVAIFKSPLDPSILYIKRVIGVPGSTVALSKCIAILNGKALEESYARVDGTPSPETCTLSEVKVPVGSYFVLNDNRADERDSRLWGFVPRGNFVAKVIWK